MGNSGSRSSRTARSARSGSFGLDSSASTEELTSSGGEGGRMRSNSLGPWTLIDDGLPHIYVKLHAKTTEKGSSSSSVPAAIEKTWAFRASKSGVIIGGPTPAPSSYVGEREPSGRILLSDGSLVYDHARLFLANGGTASQLMFQPLQRVYLLLGQGDKNNGPVALEKGQVLKLGACSVEITDTCATAEEHLQKLTKAGLVETVMTPLRDLLRRKDKAEQELLLASSAAVYSRVSSPYVSPSTDAAETRNGAEEGKEDEAPSVSTTVPALTCRDTDKSPTPDPVAAASLSPSSHPRAAQPGNNISEGDFGGKQGDDGEIKEEAEEGAADGAEDAPVPESQWRRNRSDNCCYICLEGDEDDDEEVDAGAGVSPRKELLFASPCICRTAVHKGCIAQWVAAKALAAGGAGNMAHNRPGNTNVGSNARQCTICKGKLPLEFFMEPPYLAFTVVRHMRGLHWGGDREFVLNFKKKQQQTNAGVGETTEAVSLTVGSGAGASLEADIILPDPSLSRKHARITYTALPPTALPAGTATASTSPSTSEGLRHLFLLEDLHSSAGTFLRLARPYAVPLNGGAVLKLGRTSLTVTTAAPLHRPGLQVAPGQALPRVDADAHTEMASAPVATASGGDGPVSSFSIAASHGGSCPPFATSSTSPVVMPGGANNSPVPAVAPGSGGGSGVGSAGSKAGKGSRLSRIGSALFGRGSSSRGSGAAHSSSEDLGAAPTAGHQSQGSANTSPAQSQHSSQLQYEFGTVPNSAAGSAVSLAGSGSFEFGGRGGSSFLSGSGSAGGSGIISSAAEGDGNSHILALAQAALVANRAISQAAAGAAYLTTPPAAAAAAASTAPTASALAPLGAAGAQPPTTAIAGINDAELEALSRFAFANNHSNLSVPIPLSSSNSHPA